MGDWCVFSILSGTFSMPLLIFDSFVFNKILKTILTDDKISRFIIRFPPCQMSLQSKQKIAEARLTVTEAKLMEFAAKLAARKSKVEENHGRLKNRKNRIREKEEKIRELEQELNNLDDEVKRRSDILREKEKVTISTSHWLSFNFV